MADFFCLLWGWCDKVKASFRIFLTLTFWWHCFSHPFCLFNSESLKSTCIYILVLWKILRTFYKKIFSFCSSSLQYDKNNSWLLLVYHVCDLGIVSSAEVVAECGISGNKKSVITFHKISMKTYDMGTSYICLSGEVSKIYPKIIQISSRYLLLEVTSCTTQPTNVNLFTIFFSLRFVHLMLLLL